LYSADLGTSSNNSNEVQCANNFVDAYDALKAVVEKVSSKLANMRGLVGPKLQAKAVKYVAKGNQVNIPELHIYDYKTAKSS